MNEHDRSAARRRTRAVRVYARLVRLYPSAHRRAFGEQMRQTFRDHYREAIEVEGMRPLRFWLGVVGDEGRSLAREHSAALRIVFTEGAVHMKSAYPVVVATLVVLALLGLRVWWYPAVLSAPHGGGTARSSVVGLAVIVLAYAVVALLGLGIVRARLGASGADRSAALRRAALLGALVGASALGAIAADTLLGPESPIGLGVWALVALAAAIGWGLAGLTATRAAGSWRFGIGAALWSGMVSALVGAGGEVASTLVALPRLAQNQLSNPDYLYWHQPDVQSYAIASALALGMMGLILVPIVAGVVGVLGSMLGTAGTVARDDTAAR